MLVAKANLPFSRGAPRIRPGSISGIRGAFAPLVGASDGCDDQSLIDSVISGKPAGDLGQIQHVALGGSFQHPQEPDDRQSSAYRDLARGAVVEQDQFGMDLSGKVDGGRLAAMKAPDRLGRSRRPDLDPGWGMCKKCGHHCRCAGAGQLGNDLRRHDHGAEQFAEDVFASESDEEIDGRTVRDDRHQAVFPRIRSRVLRSDSRSSSV